MKIGNWPLVWCGGGSGGNRPLCGEGKNGGRNAGLLSGLGSWQKILVSTPLAPEDFFDLERTEHRLIFEQIERVWEALPKIAPYLSFRLKPGFYGQMLGRPFIGKAVYVGKGTVVEQGAVLKGPAWIGENCEVRAGCYIRENVVVGNGCVLGNSCELKNCLIFDGAEVPHFNYVGDSILGHRAHLGAGVICSNVRLDRGEIKVTDGAEVWPTGLRKFGAIVGDYVEVGCNSVLSPGSLIGPGSLIYPGVQWRGVLPAQSIAKLRQDLHIVAKHAPPPQGTP